MSVPGNYIRFQRRAAAVREGRERAAKAKTDKILTDQFAACAWLRPNEAHHFEVRGAIGEATFTVDQIPMLEEAIRLFRDECTIDDQRSDERVRPQRVPLSGNRWR